MLLNTKGTSMSMKTGKKMKGGFMCHSPASTAVCMSHNHRSIVVPPTRRPVHRSNYFRLGDQRPMPSSNFRRSFPLPSLKNDQQKVPLEPSNITTTDTLFQVVVMRVSIHCQGCAGKVKKHLSKMEGVTSFSIDLENKRVTVMGHVSPSGVLESISKVKKAEFWPC